MPKVDDGKGTAKATDPKRNGVVAFEIKKITVDTNQFKPFSHTLVPYETLIVEVPADVKTKLKDGQALTVEGLCGILADLGVAMDQVGTDVEKRTK